MNIKTIKRKREFKNDLTQRWYKLMKPLADYIDKRDNIKYRRTRSKAKKLSDEEVIELVIKRIIKYVKKYGRLDEEIAVCTWSEENYNGNIFEFIKHINWSKSTRLLQEWCYIHRSFKEDDIEYITILTELLEQRLRDIDGIKVEYFIEDNTYNWRYKNYVKTLKVSLEE